jgi:POT family proton-dependent oligopeptide transporter
MSQVAETTAPSEDHSFFGQPRSLANIFGVEMWERFSFYGMQGILLIYLYYSAERGGLGVPQAIAAGIVGAYGGGVYLSTILGAWVADRLLGSERVLFYSAIVIMFGHIALALIPGFAGVATGLILVAFGSGGLKANATSVVGTLYRPEDPRRDAGFSLFYLGINLGAFFGPVLTGLLQSTIGFHYGFGLAAVGMAIGLVQYSFGRKRLPDAARHVPDPLPRSRWTLYIVIAVVAVVVVVVLVLMGVITASNLAVIVIGATIVAAVAYFFVILSNRYITGVERRRVYAFIPLFIASAAVMGVAFLLFLPFVGGGKNSTPLLGMIGILLVFTIAELLLSPVGLSVSTKLAPELFKTQMVALFFLSVALGTAVSGQLAKWYETAPEGLYFGVLGGIAILIGVLLAVFARPVLRMMSGVR